MESKKEEGAKVDEVAELKRKVEERRLKIKKLREDHLRRAGALR